MSDYGHFDVSLPDTTPNDTKSTVTMLRENTTSAYERLAKAAERKRLQERANQQLKSTSEALRN